MTPNTCNVENVTHINYHSDFRLIIRFNSDKLPDYPWRITFSTPSTHTVDKYVASFDGENYINCKPVDTLPGAAIVFFDHHRLGCGTLGYILDMDIPDDEFPDGKMDIEIPGVETIELWPGKSDETELPAEIIVALLQMLKGFSPSIEVEEDSEDSYILRITNETGSYLTPNLRASLNLAQSTGDSQYIAMSQDATTKALAELGYKDHVAYILKDFTKSYYNNTGSDITDRSMVVTPTQSGVTSNFSLTSRIPVAASDFIFVRMKLRVDKECSLRIITYSDNLDQRGRWFALKADRTYEIYYRGKAASVAGGLNVGISIPAATNIGQKVTIEDLIVTLNNYDAWCDAESRATLKNFDTDSFTVDEGGTGHFFSVAQACDFARDAFDVVNNAVTVFIRNGLYDHEAPKNVAMGYPYAIINKGANRISLIGESRDGVIVSYENNSVNRAKIIEAGGECTIANMTVNCLNDESYTDASAGGHQACYCIHIDSVFAASERYFTTIRNCKLFSTCHSPVGAGLAGNQTIRLDGCECVSDTHVGTSTGAATIHASTDAAAKNMAVEIIGCRLLSLDGTKALYMPDVKGGAPFTQVDVTLLGNTYYTTGPEITDADFLSRHKLTPWSDASFSEISVIAHSDCTLEARVTHLERLLMEMLSGKVLIPELQVKKLGVWGDNNLVVTGEGAPTKAPDRAGQFYVDTKNNAVYHSVGNGAVSDWKNA